MISSNTLQLHSLPFTGWGGLLMTRMLPSLLESPRTLRSLSSPIYFLPAVQTGVPFVLLPYRERNRWEFSLHLFEVLSMNAMLTF